MKCNFCGSTKKKCFKGCGCAKCTSPEIYKMWKRDFPDAYKFWLWKKLNE